MIDPILNKTTTPCYLFSGYVNKRTGYGQIHYNNVLWLVHRLSFTLAYPEISILNINVCHTCDVRKCFNPAHLFTGTQRENMLDCVAKDRHPLSSKTHCRRGHKYTTENTYLRKDRKGRGCKICREVENLFRSFN